MDRSAASRPSSATNVTRLITNDATGAAVPSRWPQASVRRPPSSRTVALAAGIAKISQSSVKEPLAATASTTGAGGSDAINVTSYPSVLQQTRVVDRGRPTSAEDGHDDRQADHDFRRRHHHHEERRDLTIQVAVHAREGDQRKVRGVQHQLDAHEHDDGVATCQHADTTDSEQDRGEDDERCGTHAWSPLPAFGKPVFGDPVFGEPSFGESAGSPSMGPLGVASGRPGMFDEPSSRARVSSSMSSASAGAERAGPR